MFCKRLLYNGYAEDVNSADELIIARKVAAEKGIDQIGSRVVANNGQHGC